MYEDDESALSQKMQGLYLLFLTRQGNLSRTQFMTAFFGLMACSGFFFGGAMVLSAALHALNLKVMVDFLFSVMVVVFFYSLSMLVIKRLNDLNVPAHYGLMGLIPIIGTVPLCCSLCLAPGRSSQEG